MSEAFAPVDIIIAKRDSRELSNEQIDWVVMPIPAASSPTSR